MTIGQHFAPTIISSSTRALGPGNTNFILRSPRTAPFSPLPATLQKNRTVYIGRRDFSTLALLFKAQGWTRVEQMEDARVVYFSQRPIPEPALRPYQRYSRLPPSHEFPNKKRMFEGLQDWSDAAGQPLWFVPETFRLTDSQSSKNNQPLMEMFRKRLYEQGGLDQTWVLKNAALDNGEGITFLPAQSHALKNVQEAMDNSTAKCVEKNPTALQYQSCSTQFVVQRYVDNLLTWFDGEKFDLRFYWFVASIDPWIVYSHDGFARVSAQKHFDATDWSTPQNHLTVHSGSALQNVTHEFIWQRVRAFATKHNVTTRPAMDPVEHVRNQIKHILSSVVAAMRYKLTTRQNGKNENDKSDEHPNNFALFGVDLMLDQNLDVYLIEVQHAPDMGMYDSYRAKMAQQVLSPILGMVEEIQNKQELDPSANLYPLDANVGLYEVITAGDWRYTYRGYRRQEQNQPLQAQARSILSTT